MSTYKLTCSFSLFWVLALISFCLAETCPRDFRGRCICGKAVYNGVPRYLVNCTNSGFDNAAMLEDMPVETEVLIFTGNNIASMPWNILGKMNDYPHLEVIDMTNNKMKEIKGKTYHRVKNVKTLILNHNQLNITGDKAHPRIFSNFINLESLHLTNAFTENIDSKEYLMALEQIFVGSNLTHLRKLHLEQNEIWSFRNPNIFCNLPSLMDLQLGDNNLTDINFNFDCLKNLRFMDLRDNRIHTLAHYTLNQFDYMPYDGANIKIDLMGNPFICDCNIVDLLHWMNHTKVQVLDKKFYTCYDGVPAKNRDKKLLNVHEFRCLTAPRQEYQGTTAVLGILVVLMIVLLAIIGYMNFNSIRTNTSSFWDQICRRGQYSTILTKPEEQEVHV